MTTLALSDGILGTGMALGIAKRSRYRGRHAVAHLLARQGNEWVTYCTGSPTLAEGVTGLKECPQCRALARRDAAAMAEGPMREHSPVTPPLDEKRARQISNAAKKAEEWRKARDEQIVQGYEEGAGVRELGRLAGLSHPAILKILAKYRQTGGRLEPDHLPPGEHVDEGNLTIMSIEEHEKLRPKDDEDSDEQG